jgi:hypothetical protein
MRAQKIATRPANSTEAMPAVGTAETAALPKVTELAAAYNAAAVKAERTFGYGAAALFALALFAGWKR